jgi:hypothetical protein
MGLGLRGSVVRTPEALAERILVARGQRVIIDEDLARLYGVATKRLNEQVRRNPDRFPPEFSFSLSRQELAILRSQIATSSWGGRRKPPLVFTEHGAIMAATVLNSPRAIQMSLFVVRAFVRLRDSLAANREIARRVDELERKVGTHDRAIVQLLGAIRELAVPPPSPKRRRIGFV